MILTCEACGDKFAWVSRERFSAPVEDRLLNTLP